MGEGYTQLKRYLNDENELSDVCDRMMKQYLEDPDYVQIQQSLDEKIHELDDKLGPDERKMLLAVVDKITDSDSWYSYKAFRQGVLYGMYLAMGK